MEVNNSDQDSTPTPPSDLEFDIVHGVNLEDMTQPLILYWNRQNALQGLNRQKKWFWLISLLFLAILAIPAIWATHVVTKIAE